MYLNSLTALDVPSITRKRLEYKELKIKFSLTVVPEPKLP